MREQRDAWERWFSPRGAMLRALVDQEAWVSAGMPADMSVLMRGDVVFLATDTVRTAVRFDELRRLRLSGRGQVVLFAFEPLYRGLTRGTGRLFANAVVYGPA